MAFIRRGYVKIPHKALATITLTRLDGNPIVLRLSDINCFEEFELAKSIGKITAVSHFLSTTVVRETYDAIDQEINGKAVTS